VGVEFIDENDGCPGLHVRKSDRKSGKVDRSQCCGVKARERITVKSMPANLPAALAKHFHNTAFRS
jgi:hypothetical protein